MAKKRSNQVVTEEEVLLAITDFQQEAEVAVGNGDRPRFKGFRLPEGLRDGLDEALDLFTNGRFSEALQKIRRAEIWLDKIQRSYCARADEKYFGPAVEELFREVVLDDDLRGRIEKRRREFLEISSIVRSSSSVSLDEASKRYWALEEAVDGVRTEQLARDVNRKARQEKEVYEELLLKAEARRRREAEEDERSRKAQARADEQKRQARESKAQELREALETIF
jgi:hypothetical protein